MKDQQFKDNQVARLILTALTIIAFVVMVITLTVKGTTNEVALTPDNKKIEVTPIQITSVKEIGQWEFLSVSDEELVDSVESRIFGQPKKIVRIYYGTLRLGVDLSQLQDDDVVLRGDTVDVTLPAISLLDNDFIDEAKTKSFYETGTWPQSTRAALFQKAKKQMLARCMTRENIHIAQYNAVEEITRVFKAMGFEYVDVHF
jgi:hypothetical protein